MKKALGILLLVLLLTITACQDQGSQEEMSLEGAVCPLYVPTGQVDYELERTDLRPNPIPKDAQVAYFGLG